MDEIRGKMDQYSLIQSVLQERNESILKSLPEEISLPSPLPMNVLPIPSNVLSTTDLELTNKNAEDLLSMMATRKVTCEAVTRAFLRRAALAQMLVNCITELLPEEAIARAKYLDTLPKPVGPLHGLPISIKDKIGMEGRTNNSGYVAWIGRKQTARCSINEILLNAGAVLYARTTAPQTIMHQETSSVIYGVTENPWNRSLTAGGSTGGEAALIALRGSVLGVGSDIGGSIRVPSANCGIYGFKPTPHRVGNTGGQSLITGQDGIAATCGPMSTSLGGLELFMRTYLDAKPWEREPDLVPIPWRNVSVPSRLKIAVMWSDGVVQPHPPVTRALQMVSERLKSCDVEVVTWEPKQHDLAWEIARELYNEDGGRTIRRLLDSANEEELPLTKWLLDQSRYKTVEEVWELKTRRNKYRAFYNEHWISTGIADDHPVDAILCPNGPGAAPPIGTSKYWSYASQWNILEYPAATFPVTFVDQGLDKRDTSYTPKNDQDLFIHSLYPGPEQYYDAPVCLQLVTRRFEDEKCLAILKKIESILVNNPK